MYYLQSRYYDPEIRRFISADGIVAGVGGTVKGYNIFAYGTDNPGNVMDPSGHWPKSFGDVRYAIVHTFKSYGRMLEALFASVTVEVGAGTGAGVWGNTNVYGVPMELSAVASYCDSITLNLREGVKLNNTSSITAGVNMFDYIDFSLTEGVGHSYSDEDCTCSFMRSSYGEKSKCPANHKLDPGSTTIGVGAGLFAGLGAMGSISMDVGQLSKEWVAIYEEDMAYLKGKIG